MQLASTGFIAKIGCAAGVLILLAGCSGTAADPATSGTSSPNSGGSDIPSLEELYSGASVLPTSDGPRAAEDKSVWVVTCGAACSINEPAAREAAEALGWDYHFADGNLNIAGGYATAIRTAISADPDAIYIQGFSCNVAQQPLQEAKDQGIPVISADGVNCDGADGQPLFTVPNPLNEQVGTDVEEFWKDAGRRAAWFLIAETEGNLKAISTDDPDPLAHAIAVGFKEEVAKCGGCEIVQTIDAPGTDLVPNGPFIQNFRSSLIAHPDANGVFLPFDVMVGPLGGAAAVAEAGSSAVVTGGLGLAETRELVDDGTLTWVSAIDEQFKNWATMDNLNRYFNSMDAVAQGVGFATVNTDTPDAIPAPGRPFSVGFDYKSIYEDMWAGQ